MRPFFISIRMMVIMTVLLGFAYPACVTLIGAAFYPAQAEGSLLRDAEGKVRGSLLLAQAETRAGRFRPRPSASAYAGDGGAASNLGPTSAALADAAAGRRAVLAAEYPGAAIPDDLVYASGSGLDPHLSPEGARFQLHRAAAELGADEAEIAALIEGATERPIFGIIGAERVNVLALNKAIDDRYGSPGGDIE